MLSVVHRPSSEVCHLRASGADVTARPNRHRVDLQVVLRYRGPIRDSQMRGAPYDRHFDPRQVAGRRRVELRKTDDRDRAPPGYPPACCEHPLRLTVWRYHRDVSLEVIEIRRPVEIQLADDGVRTPTEIGRSVSVLEVLFRSGTTIAVPDCA